MVDIEKIIESIAGNQKLIMILAVLLVLLAVGSILFWIIYRARKQRSFKLGMVCLDNRQYYSGPVLFWTSGNRLGDQYRA